MVRPGRVRVDMRGAEAAAAGVAADVEGSGYRRGGRRERQCFVRGTGRERARGRA